MIKEKKRKEATLLHNGKKIPDRVVKIFTCYSSVYTLVESAKMNEEADLCLYKVTYLNSNNSPCYKIGVNRFRYYFMSGKHYRSYKSIESYDHLVVAEDRFNALR